VKPYLPLVTLSLATVLTACASGPDIATATDYDPSVDFSAYRTYAWVPDGDDLMEEPADGFIRAAVEAELEARGLQPAGGADPDMAVGYRVATNTHTQEEFVGRGWSGGYRSTQGYSGGGAGVGMRETEHAAGTLYIILFDGGTKEAAWTGVGNGTIKPDLSPEDRQARISEAVVEIMKGYPPS